MTPRSRYTAPFDELIRFSLSTAHPPVSAGPEEIASLQEFADHLMQGVARKDAGLAYRIHMALVSFARRMGDRDMLIRELYWVGMGLYNMETSLSPGGARLFTYRMRLSFALASSRLLVE